MVNKVLVTESYLTDIANAIRAKTGSSASLTPAQMANAINGIPVSAPLVLGAIRPDAELVQTYSYDKKLVADEGITIPAYTTTTTTLKASATLGTINFNRTQYYYYLIGRMMSTPIYSTATLGAGRYELFGLTWLCDVFFPKAVTINGKTYTPLIATAPVSNPTCIYWSSATALTRAHVASYGVSLLAPTIPNSVSSNNIVTLTINSPEIRIRGGTYFSQTYFNAMTDARCQYIIEVYRVPVSSSTLPGWGQQMQFDHIMDCYSNGGTLT